MRHSIVVTLFCAIMAIFITSCAASLSDARALFEQGNYYKAADTYKKVYSKTPSKQRALRGEIAYEMGTAYRYINASARSAAAYQYAARYEHPDSTLYLYLAQSQHALGKYKDAIKNYELFLEKSPNHPLALNGLKGCELATAWKEKKTRYIVRRADLFNSRRSECCPVLLGEAYDQLYFTSANDDALGDDKSDITGLKNNDIFLARKDEQGKWQKPETIEGALNSELDEGVLCFSADGNTMYFSKARREPNSSTSVEIYCSKRADAAWSDPVKMEITSDTLSVFAHPAVSPDGKYIYFVSDMPGGEGGNDIWRAPLDGERVGLVENLGNLINTEGDEVFPSFRANGDLYFSSDGHAGAGGLDIFKATFTEYGVWQIENMQMPVNSFADDFGITFGVGESGFFSSNRNDGRGYDHIYSFELPLLQVWVEGLVLDNEEAPIPGATVRIVGKDGLNAKAVANENGIYNFQIDRDVDYVMMAGCDGFLNNKQALTSEPEDKDATYRIDFTLPTINKPVLIENIFFDFDRATVTEASGEALQELIAMLTDNPNVSIELAAHTDQKGSEEYNLRLSERRAQSVVNFLIDAGIDPKRLTPKGYGESSPKVISKKLAELYPTFAEGDVLTPEYIESLPDEEMQEMANQMNRRTEFSVLKLNYRLY